VIGSSTSSFLLQKGLSYVYVVVFLLLLRHDQTGLQSLHQDPMIPAITNEVSLSDVSLITQPCAGF